MSEESRKHRLETRKETQSRPLAMNLEKESSKSASTMNGIMMSVYIRNYLRNPQVGIGEFIQQLERQLITMLDEEKRVSTVSNDVFEKKKEVLIDFFRSSIEHALNEKGGEISQ